MNDGKIYIVVTDTLPAGMTGSGLQTGSNKVEGKNNSSESSLVTHWARTQILNTVKQIAVKSVSYTIGNIGNFTGDYITQTHINNALSTLSGFKNIASSTIAGAIQGGPIGAVIGLTLGLVSESVGSAFQIYSNSVQNRKINYEIAQLRDRAGLNSTLDGSRGTEN